MSPWQGPCVLVLQDSLLSCPMSYAICDWEGVPLYEDMRASVTATVWWYPATLCRPLMSTAGADSTSYYARVYSGREGHCVVVGRREVLGWWFCKSSAGRRDLPLVIDAEFTAWASQPCRHTRGRQWNRCACIARYEVGCQLPEGHKSQQFQTCSCTCASTSMRSTKRVNTRWDKACLTTGSWA